MEEQKLEKPEEFYISLPTKSPIEEEELEEIKEKHTKNLTKKEFLKFVSDIKEYKSTLDINDIFIKEIDIYNVDLLVKYCSLENCYKHNLKKQNIKNLKLIYYLCLQQVKGCLYLKTNAIISKLDFTKLNVFGLSILANLKINVSSYRIDKTDYRFFDINYLFLSKMLPNEEDLYDKYMEFLKTDSIAKRYCELSELNLKKLPVQILEKPNNKIQLQYINYFKNIKKLAQYWDPKDKYFKLSFILTSVLTPILSLLTLIITVYSVIPKN